MKSLKFIGLSAVEVQKSRNKHGSNRLSEVQSESFFEKLRENLKDPAIRILCFALLANVILTLMGQAEWLETVGIAVAVALAALVSTFAEYSNESSFKKLQEEASRIFCKVYRDGSIVEVHIDELVVGDLVVLQTGDKVPADGSIVEGRVEVNQAALNGESKEAKKFVSGEPVDSIVDYFCADKLYRGTVVTAGNAVMRITVVGDKSEYGKIVEELGEEDRDSPMKVKLGKLAGQISMFGYIGGISIALVMFLTHLGDGGAKAFVDAVIMAVTIIVMAVPEGLPLMIALVSSQKMRAMLKDSVLVRKIVGIETAGSLNILFSDKTGTITKGELEVVTFTTGDCTEYQALENIPEAIRKLSVLSVCGNTDAVSTLVDGKRSIIGGNGTDRALINFIPHEQIYEDIRVAGTIPFDSANKYSAAHVPATYLEGTALQKSTTFIKGAPEKLLAHCSHYIAHDGRICEMTDSSRERVNEEIVRLANRAIRVLAVTYSTAELEDRLPDAQVLIGVFGIRDEVRPESVSAIRDVQQAGVQVVMITGDRPETAVAIAKESGVISSDDDVVLTSAQLNELDDEAVKAVLRNLRVVARALPSDKSRLVRLAQELNLVVGMTGDGVNDSPALKRADVGFGMGSGTEVAKEASDIVILDDNFNSIAKAILYGRTIFNSVRKFIVYQLTINVSAVLLCFVSQLPFFRINMPLTIIQILWINLVMDTFAALAFGGEAALQRFMLEPPKRRDENIVNRQMMIQIVTGSMFVLAISVLFLATDWIGECFRSSDDNRFLLTGYFTFFIFAAVFNAFNVRTEKINLFDNMSGNFGFLRVMGLIVVVQIIITQFGGDILGGYGLTMQEWLVAVSMAAFIIPIDILRKLIVRNTI